MFKGLPLTQPAVAHGTDKKRSLSLRLWSKRNFSRYASGSDLTCSQVFCYRFPPNVVNHPLAFQVLPGGTAMYEYRSYAVIVIQVHLISRMIRSAFTLNWYCHRPSDQL